LDCIIFEKFLGLMPLLEACFCLIAEPGLLWFWELTPREGILLLTMPIEGIRFVTVDELGWWVGGPNLLSIVLPLGISPLDILLVSFTRALALVALFPVEPPGGRF
jgi:hypothetical protein